MPLVVKLGRISHRTRHPSGRRRVARRGRVVLEHFLRNRPPSTKAAYRGDLDRFGRWAGVADAAGAVELLCRSDAVTKAQAWIDSLRTEETFETRRRRATTLRALVDLACRLGSALKPLRLDPGPRERRAIDVDRLLTACGEGDQGARNRLIVLLRFQLGFGQHDVLALNRADVNDKTLWVAGRAVELPPGVRETLTAWLSLNEGKDKDPIVHVVGEPQHRLSEKGLEYVTWTIRKRAGG